MQNLKKNIPLFVILIFMNILNAQVGINTTSPKSTLDINGNLKIRSIPVVSNLPTNDQFVLLVDKNSTNGDFEVKQINTDVFLNNHAYYATKTGGWSLINLTLGLGTSWAKINLTGTVDTKVGIRELFNTGVYTAPVAGTYIVNYEFQFNAGLNLEILGGKKIGILKNNVVWDEKLFDGVRIALLVPVASAPITSTNLFSMVQLEAGDKLTFAVNTDGLVDLSLLTNAKVNVSIYRISSQTQ